MEKNKCTVCGCTHKRQSQLNAATPVIMCDDCTAVFENEKWTNNTCDICPHKSTKLCIYAKMDDNPEDKVMCHWAYPFIPDYFGF